MESSSKKRIAILLFIYLALMGFTFFSDMLKIDGCLDNGGSFNYLAFECDLQTSHPEKAYLESRLPRFLGLSAVFGLVIAVQIISARRR